MLLWSCVCVLTAVTTPMCEYDVSFVHIAALTGCCRRSRSLFYRPQTRPSVVLQMDGTERVELRILCAWEGATPSRLFTFFGACGA